MNLYLVRAETEDGHNEDRHVIANTTVEAFKAWKDETGYGTEDLRSLFDNHFIVHLVIEFDPELEPTDTGRPYVLDWSVGERIAIG